MLIILDRDGVINKYDGSYICSVDEWQPIPGSIEAVARLCKAGHRIAVATNQSGIARGFYGTDVLDAMHGKLEKLLEVHGGSIGFIAYCPHHPDDGCQCRKPLTGLLKQIRDHFKLDDLKGAVMVGDSRMDLEAGVAEGCQSVLVRTGNGKDTERHLKSRSIPGASVAIHDNLSAFADAFLSGPGLVKNG
ncbi:D-glycero-beta-D-manno-heptose 1,7-bisphosphate 7-phosphatase [Marinobacter sp. 2_MG-2023]|uniref:D-glycero-beta-D-manno-heptose 1,7-bisphosphate 7-phosphatase n=1 Tax=Marinobacter sp. 2_MG-2023 TaxID=3062679 RepID=UPI0026E27839|nr:D-glycero-beta-D-manno-heptose 1,7-bisphosphate 7-phosphatase [Marinobacter sp. 2_MG-2023]MDO6441815.1 D-glycero-beta-D-manno-heptose 1,7-bisphosphate 7-phosphatase [Marinobacter sp. 2_MG-2023]